MGQKKHKNQRGNSPKASLPWEEGAVREVGGGGAGQGHQGQGGPRGSGSGGGEGTSQMAVGIDLFCMAAVVVVCALTTCSVIVFISNVAATNFRRRVGVAA